MQGFDQNLIKIWKYNLMGSPEGWVEKVRTKEFGDKIGLGFGDTRRGVDMGGWRGGAMISPPTHCPRPFHLRPRPQLDFFRITRIRKSCGMIFLVWTQLHTWWRFENSSSLNTEAFLKRLICLSVSSHATFCQSLKQWIIKEGTI